MAGFQRSLLQTSPSLKAAVWENEEVCLIATAVLKAEVDNMLVHVRSTVVYAFLPIEIRPCFLTPLMTF